MMRLRYEVNDPSALEVLAKSIRYAEFELANVLFDDAERVLEVSFWNTASIAAPDPRSATVTVRRKLWRLRVLGASAVDMSDESGTGTHQFVDIRWLPESGTVSIEGVPTVDLDIRAGTLAIRVEVDEASEREDETSLGRFGVLPLGETALRPT